MKKIVLAFAMACGILSCSAPPFNLELSLSARTAQAMRSEGTVGPIDMMGGDAGPSDALFLPGKAAEEKLDLTNGFVVYTGEEGYRQLSFVSWDAGKKMYISIGGMSFMPAAAEPYPDRLLFTLKGAPYLLGMFTFYAANPGANDFEAGLADPVTRQFPVGTLNTTAISTLAGSAAGMTGNVIGLSVYAQKDLAQDVTHWIFKALGGNQFVEFQSPANENPPSLPTLSTIRPLFSLPEVPTGLTRVLYYHDPDPTRAPQRSFLSWYDTEKKQWRCWTWWEDPSWQSKELKDVSHRVDALLTTGELLSTEGDVGRLYSGKGTLRAAFSLTGLKLIGEYYVKGTARVLFAQHLSYDMSHWFNVYSIPTADLATLPAR